MVIARWNWYDFAAGGVLKNLGNACQSRERRCVFFCFSRVYASEQGQGETLAPHGRTTLVVRMSVSLRDFALTDERDLLTSGFVAQDESALVVQTMVT